MCKTSPVLTFITQIMTGHICGIFLHRKYYNPSTFNLQNKEAHSNQ